MFEIALVTVLLPALVAGFTVWVGRRLPATLSRAVLAPALGLAYLVGHGGVAGLPSFPPVTSTQALFWLVVVAVGVGAWEATRREGSVRVVGAIRVVFVGLLLALMVRSMVVYHWTPTQSVLWIAGLAVLLLLVWAAHARLHEVTPPVAMKIAWCLAFAGSAIALALSHSALLGQLAGVMAAAVFGALVAGGRSQESGAAGVAVLLVVHAGLLVSGTFYADLEPFRALALAVVPLAAVLGNLRPWRSDLVRSLVVGGAVVILLAPVIVLLAIDAAGENADYYDC